VATDKAAKILISQVSEIFPKIGAMKTTTKSLRVITLTLICVWFFPKTQAINPPPDGGYPGGNTAEGQSALLSLTSGTYNTAVGLFSLLSNLEGDFNTAIGAGALLANTADNNTGTGAGALLSNTTGQSNTANGTFALFSNITGTGNTAVGASALFSNTTGFDNTAIGSGALFINADSIRNTAIGSGALFFNSTGGIENTAIGFQALNHNTEGDNNTATGEGALFNNTTGNGNTAIGVGALGSNTSGSGNIGFGSRAGDNVTTADGVICIGTGVGENVSNSCYIGHIWGESGGSQAVYVNSQGKLGQMVSSRRFKDQIEPMEQASEAIYSLRPVRFRYKPEIEPKRPLGFGLIAEDVEEINPQLVTRDRGGQAHSVRYDAVNAMLLNEFLKEHRKVQKLEETIARQQEQIEALTVGLQKVTAQVETKEQTQQIVKSQ
jgi:hypothetical protein